MVLFSRSLALAALSAFVGGSGCGPSYQALYECDVRFEHCYALDQESASLDAKKSCWHDWLRSYTYGQSRDRVEYAATRESALSLDPTLPSLDRGIRPPHPPTVAAPMPTNAFAPPPNLVEHAIVDPPIKSVTQSGSQTVSTTVAVPVPAPRVPGAECTKACQDNWKTCQDGCRGGTCSACDSAYRGCAAGCFR